MLQMDVAIVIKRYLRFSFFNLLLVAFIGIILRYKILFSLPFVDQKFLLHGHSHFAFAGWITQTLMVLMVAYLSKETNENKFLSYKKILAANLLTSYGMLIAFPIQGYGLYSITFSTFSVFVSYFFSVKLWKDLNRIKVPSIVHYWFKAALLFAVFSSLGTFALAYMMAHKIAHLNWYLASVYFYLHFQYNGWFFFACVGFLHSLFSSTIMQIKKLKIIFWLFACSCVPAYLLSTLWMSLPIWLYVIVVAASALQVVAWYILVKILLQHKKDIFNQISAAGRWTLFFSATALSVKLCLQAGSTIPALGQWAFGFRSIVVAYLHLVLLGVISLFIVGFIFSQKYIDVNKLSKTGLVFFISGVFLNEFVLLLQGVASISYNVIPYSNELLLLMALLMFAGILQMFISQMKTVK